MNRRNALKTMVVGSAVAVELLISGQLVYGSRYVCTMPRHVRRHRCKCRWRHHRNR